MQTLACFTSPVSRYHGFGLMNADAMITKALTWKTVPDLIRTRSGTIYTYNRYYGHYLITTSPMLSSLRILNKVTD